MTLHLPDPDFGRLPRSPLELVVCQVRHEEREIEPTTALAIQDALGGPDGDFARIEQVEMHSAVVALGGSAVATPPDVSVGWHLKSSDGGWTVVLMPGHVALETTRYTTWSDFRPRLEGVIRAIEQAARPTMEQRLGLRYVDRVVGLGVRSVPEWSSWIDPSILGPGLHDVLGAGVQATRQQIDLDLGSGRVCILRHGTVADPGAEELAYLLDFDVFRQQARRFSADEVLATLDDFHRAADSLFQQVITPALLEHLAAESQNG